MNTYAYVGGNPLRYTDPLGLAAGLSGMEACKKYCSDLGLTVKSYTPTGLGFGFCKCDSKKSENCPPIRKQKQNEHKKGTPSYNNRVKQTPNNPPSTWDNPLEADDLTKEAWKNGTPDPNNPNVRTYETGRRVGTNGQGQGQSGVKVHQKKTGIHGHPWGNMR